MGFKYLPNGLKYFSVSEEIEQVSRIVYRFLLNVSPGFYLTILFIFAILLLVYAGVYAKITLKRIVG
jgi:hypothetical protein